MTQTARIKCINKQPRNDIYRRITHVGGYVNGAWKLTLDDAIGKIERREWKFYVAVNGKSVWVVVATSPHGNKYLRTETDEAEPNNLLSLPECP